MFLICSFLAAASSVTKDYDVLVYGSSPAGIAAAVTAGLQGMKVGLFEPLKMIGGMGAAGNLALNDGGLNAERTGLARKFSLRNGEYYYPGMGKEVPHPESFVSEASFLAMLKDADVNVIKKDCHILSVSTITGSDHVSRINTILLSCDPSAISAEVFIDASYDGDIMTAAGNIDYTWGREANTTYNESLAGARVPGFVGVSGARHVNALRNDGSILKYVQNISELGPPGSADDALMAFQHRLCITSNTSNQVPWYQPSGYQADDFLLLLRALEANNNKADFSLGNHPPGLPSSINKECTCCGISVSSSDQPNLNKGWANASWERKQEIIADHTYFEMGSYYFLSHDPRVPQSIRSKYIKYGLCADEFKEFGHIPPQLYVRISNRLVGDYGNISIAVADWSLDEHMTGKYAVPVGNGKFEVQLEGNFWPSVGPHGNWYDTPYGIMVPKRGTGGNLLVPVAVSSSAVAFSSTRIENWYMSVGSAAGAAAVQIVNGLVDTVQDVNVSQVREILIGLGQRVNGPPGHNPPPPSIPHPEYYNVTGAGDRAWNGHYLFSNQSDSGEPVYISVATNCPNHEPCSLYSYEETWRLATMNKELFYVAGSKTGALPPLSGWITANGTGPAPVLVAGPNRPNA